MPSLKKLLEKILLGQSDKSLRFDDVPRVLARLGFQERIKGSHHIFHHDRLPEIVNLQPAAGGLAKPYQVRQLRNIILQYGLVLPESEE